MHKHIVGALQVNTCKIHVHGSVLGLSTKELI